MRFALSAFIVVFATACSGNKGAKGGGGVRLIKGDPFVFVKDANLNRLNGVSQAQVLAHADWVLSIRGFEEEPVEQPTENIEDGEEAPDPAKSEAEQAYEDALGKFQPRAGGGYIFKNRRIQLRFALDEPTGTLMLESFESANGGWPAFRVGRNLEVLHTSANRKAFSLLIQSREKNDRFVLDLHFTPGGPMPAAIKTSERFKYLLGTGLKFAWDAREERRIVLCGNPGAGSAEAFERAVEAWKAPLAGRLRLTNYREPNCPPFSDVNSQVVNFIDDWVEVAGPQAKAAFATGVFNFPLGQISDQDVFFLREEWQEIYGPYGYNLKAPGGDTRPHIKQAFYETLAHEMGHLLGLHHQFDPAVPSIMGYDDIGHLTEYDIQAVQSLYPLLSAP